MIQKKILDILSEYTDYNFYFNHDIDTLEEQIATLLTGYSEEMAELADIMAASLLKGELNTIKNTRNNIYKAIQFWDALLEDEEQLQVETNKIPLLSKNKYKVTVKEFNVLVTMKKVLLQYVLNKINELLEDDINQEMPIKNKPGAKKSIYRPFENYIISYPNYKEPKQIAKILKEKYAQPKPRDAKAIIFALKEMMLLKNEKMNAYYISMRKDFDFNCTNQNLDAYKIYNYEKNELQILIDTIKNQIEKT